MMAVPLVNCVCWEWQRDDGGFSPYLPQISNAIEASNHAGFSGYDVGPARVYSVDFGRMIQRKNNTGFERKVQRKQLTLPSSPSITAFWMWNEKGTNYVLYDAQSSVDIELAYLSNSGVVDLSQCTNQLPYTIDFRRMQQIRHGYNTRRRVQRCPLPSGTSIQSLLCLAPGLTGSTGLSSGVVASATHGMGGGYANYMHAPGLGFGALTNPAPGVMSSMTPASSLPPGHVVKSGSAGLTRSINPTSQTGSKVLATLGVPLPSSTGNTAGVSLAPAASRPLHPPPPAAVSLSASTLPPTPSFPASTSTTASTAPNTSATLSSRPIAVAKRRRRRENKSTSNSTSYPSSSTACAGSSCSSSSVKTSKRSGRKVRGGSKSFHDETAKFARKKKKKPKAEEDGPCPICMNQLSEASGFEDEDHGSSSPLSICKLRKCGHMLHHPCLVMYIKSSANSGFQCPTCKKSYGVKTGDMPNGTMNVRTLPGTRLPGHEGYGAIEIAYNFRQGVYNGRRYKVSAFPRTCYLPDSPKGQKVLRLLRVAWDRRLTFTIGTSVTSGMTDTVVWNEIHHKTSINNHSGHGYPDHGYLDRVVQELAAQGVTDDTDDSDNEQGSSSSSSSEDNDAGEEVVGGATGDSKFNAIVLKESDEDSDL